MVRRAESLTPPLGSLADVAGVEVGLSRLLGAGAASGATVVVPPAGATVAVDTRGGGPATHETDILAPGTLLRGADAIVLTGGSALGLASVSGVAERLRADGVGFAVPGTDAIVPIVPGAAIFDLGRGGDPARYPGPAEGAAAYRARSPEFARGSRGAGTGALLGGGVLKGGQGTASLRTPGGHVVAALVIVNAVGTPCDSHGRLFAAAFETARGVIPGPGPDESRRWREHAAARAAVLAGRNTTIGVVATDAGLDPAMTHRLASSAHAGISRALTPSHTLADGDTLFALATGAQEVGDPLELLALGSAAADAVMLAIVDAVLSSRALDEEAREGGGAAWPPGYSELMPSVATSLGY